MRCVSVLILLAHLVVVSNVTAQKAKPPRLDVNGDPLPDGAVARLGTIRFQPQGDARAVALSPDGTTLAAMHRSGEGTRVDFLNAATGKSIRALEVAVDSDDRMQFTPDGKGLVFSGRSSIQFVDARTGKVTKTIEVGRSWESNRVTLSTDGTRMAGQPQKYVKHAPVKVWDTRTGKEVASLPGRGAACIALAFSPDGKRLLLWSLIPTQVGGDSIGFGSDSKVALACIDVGTRTIAGETTVGQAQFIALCPDGETVAIEAPDHQSIRIRHLPTGTDRRVIKVTSSRFAFAPDSKVLFTIDAARRGALWDVTKGKKIRDLEGALVNQEFDLSGISKDGQTIALLDGGWYSAPRIVVWNAATGKRIARPPAHEGTVTCIAYAPDGKALASGSIDKTVRLWDPATGKHLRILTVHKGAITAVAISSDGKLVASSSLSGLTRVCRTADGKLVAEFAGPSKETRGQRRERVKGGNPPEVLAFSQEGKVLFMGGHSPEVLARDIPRGKEVLRLKTGDDGAVMAFGNGGALAMTANGEIRAEEVQERVRVWDLMEKQAVANLPLRHERFGSVRCDAAIFSPDGRLLASSQVSEYQGIRPSYGATQLRLWERATGEPIRTLGPIITTVLAFSSNGRLLAAGGAGRSGHLRVGYGAGIDVWDTLTGVKAGSLSVSPECVAFSPDGLHLATGGRDHGVLIWETPKLPQRKRAKDPSVAECDAWWTALGKEAKDAYKAIEEMTAAPEHATTLLKERVRPVRLGDSDAVARLLVQLNSEAFTEREKAERALEKMGEGIAHLLPKAIRGKVDLEFRRRVQRLLKKCNATSTLGMQHHRAVATLEWIGSPAAHALLRALADGAPGARLTIEARAALKRLPR
jgi:WD40 repeat protein